jgi:hypothetical protein
MGVGDWAFKRNTQARGNGYSIFSTSICAIYFLNRRAHHSLLDGELYFKWLFASGPKIPEV